MSLELINKQTLWTATGLDIGAIKVLTSADSWYWTTANTLAVDADVPANAWLPIDVKDADKLYVTYSATINSLSAGTGEVTVSSLLMEAIGILDGDDSSASVPALGASHTYTEVPLDGQRLFVQGQAAVNGLSAAPVRGQWDVAVGPNGFVLGNSAVPAAGDVIKWNVQIGDADLSYSTAAPARRGLSGLNVSAFKTVYVAAKNTLTVTTANDDDIDDYDGEMVALTYREVTHTRPINLRSSRRLDR